MALQIEARVRGVPGLRAESPHSQHSQPDGLVLLKVMSMGKFQTSVVGATSLLEVIWEMPSSRPWGEKVA